MNKDDLKPQIPLSLIRPFDGLLSLRDSSDFIVNLLINESPRVIERTLDQFRYSIYSYVNASQYEVKNQIRYTDLLTLAFIKVRYPLIIDFFIKTINEILPSVATRDVELYLIKQEREKKPLNLIEWIEQVTQSTIPDNDRSIVQRLVAAVAFPYIERLNGNFDDKNKVKYEGTSSYAENLNDYLLSAPGQTVTKFNTSNQIYSEHIKNSKILQKLNLNDLYEYSRFLRFYTQNIASPKMNYDVLKVIADRIVTKKIKVKPLAIKETDLEAMIYEFSFQLLEVIENFGNDKSLFTNSVKEFKVMLLDDALPTGAKFQILNVWANNRRSPGADIHIRMDRAFSIILNSDKDIPSVIKKVFDQAEKRYFNGKDVIYRNEENFFYVLYQYWTGNNTDRNVIAKIQRVAKRGLIKYPDALEAYWSQIPYIKGTDDVNEQLRFDFPERNLELYMPLKTLVDCSSSIINKDEDLNNKIKYWSKVVKNPEEFEKYKNAKVIRNDDTTLHSVLIQRNLL